MKVDLMSLPPQPRFVVPAETANVTRAIFSKGNLCITMAACLSSFLGDEDFSPLFSSQGQPGASPLQLALVTILQYVEGQTGKLPMQSEVGLIGSTYWV